MASRPRILNARCFVASAIALTCCASHADPQVAQLGALSLEQLREVRVVTVSRLEERLDRAPASAYVITAEDIRRSGATTLPEALRLAPNLDVARADANQYAISARGFNNVLANKMLVLIDGRTVYTPLFSGVFWEAQDVVLEDVDRIEVISGPSTALWGSNAVNGLIHVITRSSKETQGALASVGAGSRERHAAGRYGTRVGDFSFRAYAKAYDRDETHRADGSSVFDQGDGVQAGFRADFADTSQRITLQGDVYEGRADQVTATRRFSGGNLLGRWERTDERGRGFTIQGYLDRTRRDHPLTFAETRDTLDVVAQYNFEPLDDHRMLVGAGYRHSADETTPSAVLAFSPPSRDQSWKRLFAQDQFRLSTSVQATVALSIEHNPYTGTELLPNARVAWQLGPDRTAWFAASRAVRAPSRVDRDLFQPSQPPFLLAGGPNFEAEVANTFEIGYRAQPDPSLSYSATLFHHQYDRLRSLAPTTVGAQFRNGIEGHTQGLETWARWRVLPSWRLDVGWVAQNQRLSVREGEVDLGGLQALGNDPHHWWSVRSAFDLSSRLAWDVAVRHVGARPAPLVPAYTAVDSRFAWQVNGEIEVAFVIQNAFDARHPEWGVSTNRVEIERSFSLQLQWRH